MQHTLVRWTKLHMCCLQCKSFICTQLTVPDHPCGINHHCNMLKANLCVYTLKKGLYRTYWRLYQVLHKGLSEGFRQKKPTVFFVSCKKNFQYNNKLLWVHSYIVKTIFVMIIAIIHQSFTLLILLGRGEPEAYPRRFVAQGRAHHTAQLKIGLWRKRILCCHYISLFAIKGSLELSKCK